jgi:ketosteroid isomerase-like protein
MTRLSNPEVSAAVVGCLLLLGGTCHAAAHPPSADVRQITAIEKVLATETDVDKVMAHYADNALLIDIAAPGWYAGREQIRSAIEPQLAGLQSITYKMDEISVVSDGKFACAAMQIHFDARKKDAPSLTMGLRQIDAFEKIDGKWLIIQQHVSVPVDQKTATPLYNAAFTDRGALPSLEKANSADRPSIADAKEQIRKWLTASEVPHSIDEMQGYYGPGEDFLIFDWWAPREVRGHKEVLDYYGPQFTGVRDMDISIPVSDIRTDGDFGVEASQQHLSMNMQDGTRQLISFRQTDCVHRVGNAWYSFFEMGSFPVDTKTGKAIMVNPDAFRK